jgi:hypothetical protein
MFPLSNITLSTTDRGLHAVDLIQLPGSSCQQIITVDCFDDSGRAAGLSFERNQRDLLILRVSINLTRERIDKD